MWGAGRGGQVARYPSAAYPSDPPPLGFHAVDSGLHHDSDDLDLTQMPSLSAIAAYVKSVMQHPEAKRGLTEQHFQHLFQRVHGWSFQSGDVGCDTISEVLAMMPELVEIRYSTKDGTFVCFAASMSLHAL